MLSKKLLTNKDCIRFIGKSTSLSILLYISDDRLLTFEYTLSFKFFNESKSSFLIISDISLSMIFIESFIITFEPFLSLFLLAINCSIIIAKPQNASPSNLRGNCSKLTGVYSINK